jgi:hypothetical protein
MQPAEINTQFFTIPNIDFDILEIKTALGTSSFMRGVAPAEVEVPADGMEVNFKTGGGQECACGYFVTTSWEPDLISPNLHGPAVCAPGMFLKKDDFPSDQSIARSQLPDVKVTSLQDLRDELKSKLD